MDAIGYLILMFGVALIFQFIIEYKLFKLIELYQKNSEKTMRKINKSISHLGPKNDKKKIKKSHKKYTKRKTKLIAIKVNITEIKKKFKKIKKRIEIYLMGKKSGKKRKGR